VKAYFVKKGISESRLTSTGYGDSQPIAPNMTAAGRQKNRRVEMVLKNY
jgi:outer membrane protein OmpA-like peptidoglycan-associated protein